MVLVEASGGHDRVGEPQDDALAVVVPRLLGLGEVDAEVGQASEVAVDQGAVVFGSASSGLRLCVTK